MYASFSVLLSSSYIFYILFFSIYLSPLTILLISCSFSFCLYTTYDLTFIHGDIWNNEHWSILEHYHYIWGSRKNMMIHDEVHSSGWKLVYNYSQHSVPERNYLFTLTSTALHNMKYLTANTDDILVVGLDENGTDHDKTLCIEVLNICRAKNLNFNQKSII